MIETPQAERTEQAPASADFGLRPGMTVEVLTLENRLFFVGKVDSVRGGAVILRQARGDELPPVMYNREIKLRFFQGKDSRVLHGKVCGSTELIWKVDRLESKFLKEQRAFFRQRISVSVEGKCFRRSSRGIVARESRPCQVLDVSAGGLLLLCEEAFEVGDRMALSGIRLASGMAPFSFNCQVRRVGGRELGMVRYGCQLEALPPKEQDRLLQAIFAVQREEIRRQKEREGR